MFLLRNELVFGNRQSRTVPGANEDWHRGQLLLPSLFSEQPLMSLLFAVTVVVK